MLKACGVYGLGICLAGMGAMAKAEERPLHCGSAATITKIDGVLVVQTSDGQKLTSVGEHFRYFPERALRIERQFNDGSTLYINVAPSELAFQKAGGPIEKCTGS